MYPPKAKKPVSHWIMSHFLGPLVFFSDPSIYPKNLGTFSTQPSRVPASRSTWLRRSFLQGLMKGLARLDPPPGHPRWTPEVSPPFTSPGRLEDFLFVFFGTSNLEYPKEARHEQRKYNKCLLFAIQIHIFAEIRIIYNKVHIQNKEEPPPPPFSFAVFTCFYNLSQTKI